MIVEQQELEYELIKNTNNEVLDKETSADTVSSNSNVQEAGQNIETEPQEETTENEQVNEPENKTENEEKKEETDNQETSAPEEDEFEKRRKQNRWVIIALILIILFQLIFICIKILDFGLNSVTAWEVDSIELTEENLQILNDTKLNIFGGKNSDRGRKNCSNIKRNIQI